MFDQDLIEHLEEDDAVIDFKADGLSLEPHSRRETSAGCVEGAELPVAQRGCAVGRAEDDFVTHLLRV